jgi:hypothetical protein
MHSLLWILGLVSVLLVASSIGRLFVQEKGLLFSNGTRQVPGYATEADAW